ncbi:hypothetical protein J6590_099140, partial [Homalodisca vitripennis]
DCEGNSIVLDVCHRSVKQKSVKLSFEICNLISSSVVKLDYPQSRGQDAREINSGEVRSCENLSLEGKQKTSAQCHVYRGLPDAIEQEARYCQPITREPEPDTDSRCSALPTST